MTHLFHDLRSVLQGFGKQILSKFQRSIKGANCPYSLALNLPLDKTKSQSVTYHLLIIVTLFIGSNSLTDAQPFLKSLDHQQISLERKITHFKNGDILIGDSSIEGLRDPAVDGKIFLTRVDQCGAVIWSYTYHQRNVYLEFRDFQIGDQDEIFVYGSAYRNGFEELIYLLKVTPDGTMEKFHLYHPGTIDHFSYTLDLHQGQLMCYGLLLDFETQKEGFVAIFDDELNPLWAVKFTPFNTGGEAIFTSDGGVLCRSDAFLYKLDKRGKLEWASRLNIDEIGVPISGPLEVQGGFILQGYREGLSFLFKVDNHGIPLWQSHQFPSLPSRAALHLLPDEEILMNYTAPYMNENTLGQLVFSSRGIIRDQRYFFLDGSLDASRSSMVVQGNLITILANRSLYDDYPVDIEDFILQFSSDTMVTDCFGWDSHRDRFGPPAPVRSEFFDTTILALELTKENDTRAYQMVDEYAMESFCEAASFDQRYFDTVLTCPQDWQVELPEGGFYWIDSGEDKPRTLRKPGVYFAKNRNCSEPITLTYQLDKPACDCDIYIPNAFTPNGDNQNDELDIFAGCTLLNVELTIRNRWGQIVFQGRDQTWDGTISSSISPPGLYLAQVYYEVEDDQGQFQSGTIYQEVYLLH